MGCRKFKIQDCFTVKYPDSSACTANLAEGRKAPSDNKNSSHPVSMEGHARRVRISFPKAFLFLIQHLLLELIEKILTHSRTSQKSLKTYDYDAYCQLSNLQAPSGNISKNHHYDNALSKRTTMTKSGIAFTASDVINYIYNDRSEVTSASSTVGIPACDFSYSYDQIGNRETYDTTESGSNIQSVYTTNTLNQYTNITNPAKSPTYNDDGCMLTNGDWTYTWNAENRMVKATSGTTVLDFIYDYMGRRVEKKVTEDGTVIKQVRFVYDDYVQIEELDALNSNGVAKKRIWGAGEFLADIHGSNAYYAFADASGNITEYIDGSGTIQEHTEYSPFGKITKQTGAMAGLFAYGYSSEYRDSETGDLYFNYRYYDVDLGRWRSKDPIGEQGGLNLYVFTINNPMIYVDSLGLGISPIDLIKAAKDINGKLKSGSKLQKELTKAKDEAKKAVEAVAAAKSKLAACKQNAIILGKDPNCECCTERRALRKAKRNNGKAVAKLGKVLLKVLGEIVTKGKTGLIIKVLNKALEGQNSELGEDILDQMREWLQDATGEDIPNTPDTPNPNDGLDDILNDNTMTSESIITDAEGNPIAVRTVILDKQTGEIITNTINFLDD